MQDAVSHAGIMVRGCAGAPLFWYMLTVNVDKLPGLFDGCWMFPADKFN